MSEVNEHDAAVARLREIFPRGATVSTLVRHVSQSGMTRVISVLANGEQGPEDVSFLVARAVGRRLDKRGGVVCRGVGMDMGFDLAYSLAGVLYGEGYALSHRWV